MRIRVFEPFQRVYTPRTPDSSYDSFGVGPLNPIVLAPLLTESIGMLVELETATYSDSFVSSGVAEGTGMGVKIVAASYSP
jgi:hypothetical protein